MKNIKSLPVLVLMAALATIVAPTNAGDPWASMGVTCNLEPTTVTIRDQDGCSKSGVRVKFCQGTCRSGSAFRLDYPYFTVACNCCKSVRTKPRPVLLSCPGGSYRVKWIRVADKCSCQKCT